MEVNPLVLLSCCVGWVSSSDAMGSSIDYVFSFLQYLDHSLPLSPLFLHIIILLLKFFTPCLPPPPALKMWTSFMYVPYGNSIQTISRDSHYEYARFSLARLLHKYEQVNIGNRKENMNIFDFCVMIMFIALIIAYGVNN